MARTVKADEFTAKRREILDAAAQLVFTKGYERMAIRDILEALGISSGAFHHYFGSREALLQAFIERTKEESQKPLLPILQDPQLSAIQKLQRIFDTQDQLRMANKDYIGRLARVWYTDDNALVRDKVNAAIIERHAPLYAALIRQGMREGAFTVTCPEETAEVILNLLRGMGDTHARLLLALALGADQPAALIERIVRVHAATMEAIERTLGAPANSLRRTDAAAVKAWAAALQTGSAAV